MERIHELKAAIDKLSPQERCELMALLSPMPSDEWDRQMMADAAPGGRLDQLKQSAHRDFQDGKCKECGEIPGSP